MSERTSTVDAIERIATWLNLHSGQEINRAALSRAANLHWATAARYLDLLERLQVMTPQFTVESGKILIGTEAPAFGELRGDQDSRLAFALQLLEQQGGGELPEHLNQESSLEELRNLGYLEGNTLTPAGRILAHDAEFSIKSYTSPPNNSSSWHSQVKSTGNRKIAIIAGTAGGNAISFKDSEYDKNYVSSPVTTTYHTLQSAA